MSYFEGLVRGQRAYGSAVFNSKTVTPEGLTLEITPEKNGTFYAAILVRGQEMAGSGKWTSEANAKNYLLDIIDRWRRAGKI